MFTKILLDKFVFKHFDQNIQKQIVWVFPFCFPLVAGHPLSACKSCSCSRCGAHLCGRKGADGAHRGVVEDQGVGQLDSSKNDKKRLAMVRFFKTRPKNVQTKTYKNRLAARWTGDCGTPQLPGNPSRSPSKAPHTKPWPCHTQK